MSSPLIEFSRLISATNNFSDKIGAGSFGPVYKGRLPDGQEIAIKRLSNSLSEGSEELKNEVTVLSKLQHPNLVRLLGCCVHGEEKMLVHEYMPNNSLESFIFDESKRLLLGWKLRSNIIQGIGKGLLYLHRDCGLNIIHKDLKASNVLLDEDFNPKIRVSYFLMARVFGEESTCRVGGIIRYVAPEYMRAGKFSEKSDVFSFGVLILEIMCGRWNHPFIDQERPMNLVSHARTLWEKDCVSQLIDPLMGTDYPYEEVCKCIQVSLLCVLELPRDRPDMRLTLAMLCGDAQVPARKPGAFPGRVRARRKKNQKST